jgi:hypothetical protein
LGFGEEHGSLLCGFAKGLRGFCIGFGGLGMLKTGDNVKVLIDESAVKVGLGERGI